MEKEDNVGKRDDPSEASSVPPLPAPNAPKMVWYGYMRCYSCENDWRERLETPSTECPRCGSRKVMQVLSPRRRFAWIDVSESLLLIFTILVLLVVVIVLAVVFLGHRTVP